jgi:rhodanese-related sulfurtransferase
MTNISVAELKHRMDAGEVLHIIDVREPQEYAEFNINGKLLPLGAIQNMQIEEIEHLRNDEVIVHCKVGGRSFQACMLLEQMGFTNVVNVTGGMMAWKQMIG